MMRPISTLASEAALFEIKNLKPFGCLLTAKDRSMRIDQISPDLLQKLIYTEQLLIFRNFTQLDRESFLQASSKLISNHKEHVTWDFGAVMELKEDPHAQNYLFTTEAVPFHWDGAFHTEPSFLLFHCLKAPKENTGGATLFTNTQDIFKDLTPEQITRWQSTTLTYQSEKKAHYGGSFTTPLFKSHPLTKETIIRFAEPVATKYNPVTVEIFSEGVKQNPSFLDELQKLYYEKNYCYEHQWRQGDYVIADNHALVHGRQSYYPSAPRHIRRIQLK